MSDIHELRSDLADIIHQTVRFVNTKQESHQSRSWNGQHVVENVIIHEVTCVIPVDGLRDGQEELLHIFQHWLTQKEKINVGRFKGMLPIQSDTAYSEATFGREMRVKFLCDYIEAPRSVGGLMDWELAQLNSMPDKVAESPKPQKQSHFSEDLFDI